MINSKLMCPCVPEKAHTVLCGFNACGGCTRENMDSAAGGSETHTHEDKADRSTGGKKIYVIRF